MIRIIIILILIIINIRGLPGTSRSDSTTLFSSPNEPLLTGTSQWATLWRLLWCCVMMTMTMLIIMRPLPQTEFFLMGFFSRVVLSLMNCDWWMIDGNGVEDSECSQLGKMTNRDEIGSMLVETQADDFLFSFNLTFRRIGVSLRTWIWRMFLTFTFNLAVSRCSW